MRRDPQRKKQLRILVDDMYDMAKTPCYLKGASLLNSYVAMSDLVERGDSGIWSKLQW